MSNFEKTVTLPETGCTRDDFYDLAERLRPTAEVVEAKSMAVRNYRIGAGYMIPFWRRYRVGFADFSAAAAANNVELFSLPAGGAMHAIKLKSVTAFSGGAVSAVAFDIGIASDLDKYVAGYDALAAVSGTNFRVARWPLWDSLLPAVPGNTDGEIGGLTISAGYSQSEVTALRDKCEELADDLRTLRSNLLTLFSTPAGVESQASATSIRIQARTTGGDLNVLSAGVLDVWVLWSLGDADLEESA